VKTTFFFSTTLSELVSGAPSAVAVKLPFTVSAAGLTANVTLNFFVVVSLNDATTVTAALKVCVKEAL